MGTTTHLPMNDPLKPEAEMRGLDARAEACVEYGRDNMWELV